MGKIVIISDMHFGVDECNFNIDAKYGRRLNDIRKKNIDNFFSWLNQYGVIEEFIFIGDIFDLQLSNFAKAVTGSYYFFKKLSKMKHLKKITYIPGNHDP